MLTGMATHPNSAPQQAKRVRVLLAAIVVPLVLVALVGLVAIYPSTNTKMGSRAFFVSGLFFGAPGGH